MDSKTVEERLAVLETKMNFLTFLGSATFVFVLGVLATLIMKG
jgi:hypothetical protein